MRAWTQPEVSTLEKVWHTLTDREIANLLGRSLEAVRSRRHRAFGNRWASPARRWEGTQGIAFENDLVREYQRGVSQALLSNKFHVDWSKLRRVLISHRVTIRDKSQQAFFDKHGMYPCITRGLSISKLYIIFAMFGDGLRPTSQRRRGTHIMGVAAGKDKDFAENWTFNFEREYSVRPSLTIIGTNNIQASISSLDIWNDLHRYAMFGTWSWKLREVALQHLMSNKVSPTAIGYGLRGYFDADGSVKYQVERASRQVTVSSVNVYGLKQISMLLGKIGIQHSLYKDNIAIFGRRNLLEYQKLIGFGIARKNEALNNMISTFRER